MHGRDRAARHPGAVRRPRGGRRRPPPAYKAKPRREASCRPAPTGAICEACAHQAATRRDRRRRPLCQRRQLARAAGLAPIPSVQAAPTGTDSIAAATARSTRPFTASLSPAPAAIPRRCSSSPARRPKARPTAKRSAASSATSPAASGTCYALRGVREMTAAARGCGEGDSADRVSCSARARLVFAVGISSRAMRAPSRRCRRRRTCGRHLAHGVRPRQAGAGAQPACGHQGTVGADVRYAARGALLGCAHAGPQRPGELASPLPGGAGHEGRPRLVAREPDSSRTSRPLVALRSLRSRRCPSRCPGRRGWSGRA